MSNSFYTKLFSAAPFATARSASINAEFQSIQSAFDAVELNLAPKASPVFSGNVGIGTASPARKLEVSGASAYLRVAGTGGTLAGLELSSSGVVNWSLRSNHSGGGDFALYQDSTERLRVDSSGNVGIGTSSPQNVLHLKAASGLVALRLEAATDGTLGFLGAASGLGSGAPSSSLMLRAENGLEFSGGANNRHMRLDTSGSLGIGTTAPSASAVLDVQSTTRGVRFPNMTTAQRTAIATPSPGLVVFDTNLSKLCVHTGAAWQTITSA